MKYDTKLLLFLLFIAVSCKNDANINDVDNNGLVRFDKLISDENQFSEKTIAHWFAIDSTFTSTYLFDVLEMAEGNAPATLAAFKNYLNDQGAITAVNTTFADLKPLENEFALLNKTLISNYPDYGVLQLRTCYSGFTLKNFLLENSVGVALDMYLGSAIDYNRFGEAIPAYRTPTLHKDFIIPDIAESIYRDMYVDKAEYNTLLERMLYFGKQALFKKTLAPNSQPNLLISMSEEEYNWCEENEALIWQFFIEQELLFSNEYQAIKTYINPGPFSANMPEESPANTGTYIGFKIMQAYAQKNKKMRLKDLLALDNAQELLNSSNYKP